MKKYRITFNAPVTLGFALLCLLATAAGEFTGGRITQAFFMTYNSSWINPMTYIRLITHVFGHSGWEHFAGNITYILLLGPLLEEKHGSQNMIGIIGTTAAVTGILNNIFFPHTALCGASGVVFAMILLSSLTGHRDHEIPLTFILVAVVFLGQQVLSGMFVKDSISNLAHIAGGVTGSVIGYGLTSKKSY